MEIFKRLSTLLEGYLALGDHFDRAQAFLGSSRGVLTLGQREEALQSLRNALQRPMSPRLADVRQLSGIH